jgi:hypothetical protein
VKPLANWPTSISADGRVLADLTASDFVMRRPADVLELVGAGVDRAVLNERQLPGDFFDLSSGFAGELLQKCSNYGIKIAVVGQQETGRSTSFRQFAHESNRGNKFFFVASVEEGVARLTT